MAAPGHLRDQAAERLGMGLETLERGRKRRDHRLSSGLSLLGRETVAHGEIVDRLAALRVLQNVVERHDFHPPPPRSG